MKVLSRYNSLSTIKSRYDKIDSDILVGFIIWFCLFLSILIINLKLISSITVIAYISGINFYLLPLLIGTFVLTLIKKYYNFKFPCFIFRVILGFYIGYLIIPALVIILVNSLFWNNYIFMVLLIIIIGVYYLRIILKNSYKDNPVIFLIKEKIIRIIKSKLNINYIISLAIFIIFFIISYKIEFDYLPFPLINAQSTELWYSLHLFEGNSLPYSILSAHPNPDRLPTIVLIGLISAIFNIHPLYVYHTVPRVMLLIYMLATFLLSYKILRSTISALLSAFLAPNIYLLIFRMSAGNMVIYMFPLSLFLYYEFIDKVFLPDYNRQKKLLLLSLVALFIPLVIIVPCLFIQRPPHPGAIALLMLMFLFMPLLLIKNSFEQEIFLINYTLASFITWNHAFNSIFFIFFLLIILFSKIYFHNFSLRKKIIYFFAIIFLISFILLQVFEILKFPSNFMLSDIYFKGIYKGFWFDMDGREKWLTLNNNYSTSIVILLALIGLFMAPLQKDLIPLASAFAGELFLYFFPEGHFHRAYYTCFHTPSSVIISFVVTLLPTYIINRFLVKNKNKKIIYMKIKVGNFSFRVKFMNLLIIILLIFFSFMISNSNLSPIKLKVNYIEEIRNFVNREGYYSYITMEDVKCALWLFSHTPKQWVSIDYFSLEPKGFKYTKVTLKYGIKYIPLTNDTLLISDPYTMIIVSALSGRDIPIYQVGYPYLAEYSEISIEVMKYIKYKIFLANSSKQAYMNIQKIKDGHEPVLIILNGRVLAWIKSEKYFIYNNPLDIKILKQTFTIFFDQKYFEKIWSNEKILIIKVKRNINE